MYCSTNFYAVLLSCIFNKHRSFTNSTRLMVHIHPHTQEPLSGTYVFFQSLVCFYLWFNILLLVFLSLLIRSECDKTLKIYLVSLWHDSAKISAFNLSILFKRKKTAILHCSTHHLRTSTLKDQLSVNCQEKINICSNVPLEFDYFDVQSNTLSEKITMKVVNNSHGNDWANEKKPVEFRISLDELVNIAALSYRPTVTR